MFIALILASALFFTLLAVKQVTKKRFCVICVSISLTWLSLLVASWAGRFDEPVVVGLLLGQSIVGVYYLLEKRLAEKYHAFRLPFLLTASVGAYFLVRPSSEIIPSFLIIGLLWLVFGAVYALRHKPAFRKAVDRLIACCRDW